MKLFTLRAPPDEVPCYDMTGMFLDPAQFRNPTNAVLALTVCASCPIATRKWCWGVVRPTTSRFDGIAAGIIFSNGVPISLATLTKEWHRKGRQEWNPISDSDQESA